MGGYRRRRYSRSSRSYGQERARAHIEEASAFADEVGNADSIVKNAFFSLSGSARDGLLRKYETLYGASAREYAQQTIPKWKSGAVRMSGMVAKRLFALMPPLMPTSQKHQIVEAVWKRYGPHSRKYVYVGPGSDPRDVLAAIEQYFETLTVRYAIPKALERQFDWLSDNDVVVKQQLLNHFMDEQRKAALASARLNLDMILERMQSDDEMRIAKLSHTVFVGNHQLEIRADRFRTGFVLSDASSNDVRPKSEFRWPTGCLAAVAVVVGVLWLAGNIFGRGTPSQPVSTAKAPLQQADQPPQATVPGAVSQALPTVIVSASSTQVLPPSTESGGAARQPPLVPAEPPRSSVSAPTPAVQVSPASASRSRVAPLSQDGTRCTQSVVANVLDDGATVIVGDGTSYTISTNGVMRYSAAQWSTGDEVRVCQLAGSGGTIYASLANPSHYDTVQGTLASQDRPTTMLCTGVQITRVTENGALVDTTDGSSYEISAAGVMRYSAAQWSTGDAVQVCRTRLPDGSVAASIANPGHYDKLQAIAAGHTRATSVSCRDTTIASVSSGGDVVATSDGRSYIVSPAGVMRYSVQQWSTSDRVTLCEALASDGSVAASITNPQHYDKVQATRT